MLPFQLKAILQSECSVVQVMVNAPLLNSLLLFLLVFQGKASCLATQTEQWCDTSSVQESLR